MNIPAESSQKKNRVEKSRFLGWKKSFLQNSITFKKANRITRNSEFKCTIPKTKLVTGSNGF